ncbi:MAG TPA: hypothetical protein VMH04_22315 [Candidatus Solibacter sp.]|nr:hypothetical protein [Candidatus Solibacter sp.]
MPDLGFRYTPPPGLHEVTTPADREARSHAASHSDNTLGMLLDARSNPNDSAPDWHQVWIETYPRARWSKLTDSEAESKMNVVSAGPRGVPVGKPQAITIAGKNFVLSEFEDKEPPLLKHAKIYTTICKTQLVAFIFVSNAADQIKPLEESLKSLSFSAN